jgi:hypothetical protein
MQFVTDPAIHQLFVDAIMQHQQALMSMVPGSPGGGNQENPNMPVGNAADQSMMKEPLHANPANKKTAIMREAKKGTQK